MKLYLVRHGEAVSEKTDPQRPLSPVGKKEVAKVAQFLKRAGVKVNEFYHSPLKRAQETAEIIRNTIYPSGQLVSKDYISPDDETDKMVYELSQRKEDLMIVSHLPFLPKFISRIVIKDENINVIGLETASVLAMYRDIQDHWQIVWLVSPSLIVD